MAMTRNAAAALNPVELVGFVRDLGADYVKLLAVSVLLGALLVVTSAVAARSWFLGFLGEVTGVWTVLALFLATGATLRAHSDDFDLLEALDDADVRETRRKHADWQKTLDIAYAAVRSGLATQAYRTIKDLIADEGDSLEIYQWAFNGMLEWDPPEHAAMLGETIRTASMGRRPQGRCHGARAAVPQAVAEVRVAGGVQDAARGVRALARSPSVCGRAQRELSAASGSPPSLRMAAS